MKYTGEWREYVTRQARWVDFDNDYKTLNPTYMESVSGRSSSSTTRAWSTRASACLPYCWNDQTPLSNHELRMDDEVYQNRQDPAVTVGLPPRDRRARPRSGRRRPWTLPSNLAHGRGPRHRLRRRRVGLHRARTERYLLAEARLAAYARELGGDDPAA